MSCLRGILAAIFVMANTAGAFSLLGPFADWMDITNGLRLTGTGRTAIDVLPWPADVGGAMEIGQEYRWNTPVLTYGFDQSFLDYFGTSGVAAVDQAVQILNSLPEASAMDLANFSQTPYVANPMAQAKNLCDLKSMTLNLLLEQMGLAQPSRHIYDLFFWDPFLLNYHFDQYWEPWFVPYFFLQRNYDPISLSASKVVNGTLYYGEVIAYELEPLLAIVLTIPMDPTASRFSSIRERPDQVAGEFVTGLSQDDAGGLRFLLSSNNLNYETLLPDVYADPTNSTALVNAALRPGVEKINFVRHPNPGSPTNFITFTNHYVDRYFRSNQLWHQSVIRIVNEPDILFSAVDAGVNHSSAQRYLRTGTGNWINNAGLNGNPTNAGPGIIQPPVRIGFNRMGLSVSTDEEDSMWIFSSDWASFNTPNLPPLVYPTTPATDSTNMVIRLRFFSYGHMWKTTQQSIQWQFPVPFGGTASFETSTNLTDWTPLTSLTNRGTVVDWIPYTLTAKRFFRATVP